MKYKVDIIIPIYNSVEWLKICVDAIFLNTNLDILNKIYMVDDCSNKETKEYLKEVKRKYGDFIDIHTNKENMGFVKNCNLGLKKFEEGKADFVLLLNTDCIVSKNAIEKMANQMRKNKKVGLLCPISSVAANISYPIPEGMNFMQVNEVFEEQFSGKMFDACTVVGNCLMISKSNVKKVGYLDEIFEKGYTEETDYQFKSMEKGFEAKVLIDTYVYHQCRVSFGESEEQLEIRRKHLDIFFKRWGKEYDKLFQKYSKNDPIKYINENVDYSDVKYDSIIKVRKQKELDMTSKTINKLALNGINIQVKCKDKLLKNYNGIMLFNIKKGR